MDGLSLWTVLDRNLFLFGSLECGLLSAATPTEQLT